MSVNLPDKPEVWQIAGIIGIDADSVVGKLLRVWAWFDAHTEDGNAEHVTYPLVDRVAGVIGFAEAMALAGWLSQRGSTLCLPHFSRHNGKTAKNRALTNERVAKHRQSNDESNADGNGASVTKTVTREEKRREEKKEKGASKSRPSVTLKTYLQTCREEGRKPVPDDHAVRAYCRDAGIPDEMLQVAWCVFRDDYTAGTNKDKRYKDWPGHFQNAVRGCWAKLWFSDAGEVKWTSRGLQEKTVLDARMKAKEEAHAA